MLLFLYTLWLRNCPAKQIFIDYADRSLLECFPSEVKSLREQDLAPTQY